MRWPFGHPLGEPGNLAQQFTVLYDAFQFLYAAKPGEREPRAMTEGDVVRLRDAGFTDRAILEINLAAAYMSFVNRVAEGLGVEVEDHFSTFTR